MEVLNLYHILCKHPHSSKFHVNLLFSAAHIIEVELHKKSKKSSNVYQCEMYSFKNVLDPNTRANKGTSILLNRIYQLLTVVWLKNILPKDIYIKIIYDKGIRSLATLVRTPIYEFSYDNISHIEYAERRSKSKIKHKTTKLYKCAKCFARETIVVEKQVRCLDEPTTSFITCMKCGHHWKH